MEQLSLKRYINLIIKDWKILAYFVAVMFIVSILYGVIMYRPSYKSTAKILVKNEAPTTFVVDLGINVQKPSMANMNPILTKIEIISSDDLIANVAEKLKEKEKYSKYQLNQLKKAIKSSVSYDSPPGTDIIVLSVKWLDAIGAQEIAKLYYDSFVEYNVQTNRRSVLQSKSYINKQLEKSTEKLSGIRAKIESYRKDNSSLNIEKESLTLIDQITSLEQSLTEIDSQYNSALTKNKSIADKLGFDVTMAINSVAIGQNTNITALKNNLLEVQQKYASMQTRYPETNIKMAVIRNNIEEIKKQIEEQKIATVGQKLEKDKSFVITDPVRMKLVDELVAAQVEIDALRSQKKSLSLSLKKLRDKQTLIPTRQKNLESLLQDELITANVVKTLSTKLVEAEIRESEILSGVELIEQPTLPVGASFPTFFHRFIILEFIGVLFGLAYILGIYFVKDICQGAEELEEILEAPVFGVIPWVASSNFKSTSEFNPTSALGIAYQRILASFKIKCLKKGSNVITLSTTEFEKRRSFISATLAKNIVKTNKSVVIIDADFRTGCIKNEFDTENLEHYDLTSLLVNITDYISKEKYDAIHKEVDKALVQIPDYLRLFIISNNGDFENPYELLTTQAFSVLINTLKEKFDYVLIDTPPILSVPDAISISQHTDGLILLCGVKTSRSNLKKISKICSDNDIDIFGAIARDNLSEIDIPENQYIKELSINQLSDGAEPEELS